MATLDDYDALKHGEDCFIIISSFVIIIISKKERRGRRRNIISIKKLCWHISLFCPLKCLFIFEAMTYSSYR